MPTFNENKQQVISVGNPAKEYLCMNLKQIPVQEQQVYELRQKDTNELIDILSVQWPEIETV